jgi:glycopeptide antibiotics resistance protein
MQKLAESNRQTYYWFVWFALCFISYQLVQDTIRPNYSSGNALIIYFLGVAPNFFPAVGIPALLVILIPVLSKKRSTNKWLTEKRHFTANLISLLGLLTWELVQILTKSGRFDWNDMLWTIIGAFIFQLIWQITPFKFKEL